MTLDELLARVAEHQDREAFRLLTREVAPRLKARALRCLRDEAQAEEIVQDVLVCVWRRAQTFQPGEGSAWGWLYGIARYRIIDHVRREQNQVEMSLLEGPHARDPAWVPSSEPSPDGAAEASRAGSRLRQALATLPDEQRAAVEAAYLHGHSLTEIADHEGIAVGTAKSRVRLAMQKLREIYLVASP